MTDSTHQQLLGHLLGALDDDEQAWMDERLDRDDSCRQALSHWRRRLSPLEALRPDFDPPPGLTERTCRMVAAYGPPPARTAEAHRALGSDRTVPASSSSSFGWHDVVALGVLLLAAVALLFPAIDDSRFQSGVTFCQDNLRRLGVAISQYGHRHGEDIDRFANNGRLTAAGIVAADVIDAAPLANQHLCPKAWLASQGASCNLSPSDRQGVAPPIPGTSVPGHFFACPSNDWSGDWRDGTTDGSGDRLPAIMAMFADDPSVELPGRRPCGHRGRGRNLFFRDGRINFIPCTIVNEAAENLLPFDETAPAADVSAPIIYVNHR
ncbi:MAG: hypothetical protein JW719_13020 [Pirellulales bacterium]|nr:hypothetical protein [Pirellulales bacterium]